MLNDKEMDVLVRRYAKSAAPSSPVEHPDADELNAFAEGALPAASRQRYLSHFADCDDCRKLVSQLAVTTGAGAEAHLPASEPVAEPWWRRLGVLWAPATLRYAAFAAVLLAVVGTAFLVWRRPDQQPNTALVAQHQPQSNPADALKPGTFQEDRTTHETTTGSTFTTPVPRATVPALAEKKQLDSNTSPPPPAKPAEVVTKAGAPVATGALRADEAARQESSPGYAPAPTTTTQDFRVENRAREQQNPGRSPGGPRRNESYDKYKELERARAADVAKNRDDDQLRLADQPATVQKKADDSPRTASRAAVVSARRDGADTAEGRKAKAESEGSEEAPETRTAGGRKFKRQGNAWVDSKFKSSMSVRNIARGSEDFDKLDSGLRAIANQLKSEVLVVWKGKAYRIR